jgi:hypothetical protein
MKQGKKHKSNPGIPKRQDATRHGMDPGQDSAAKTNRKGAGEQQRSGGNSTMNS